MQLLERLTSGLAAAAPSGKVFVAWFLSHPVWTGVCGIVAILTLVVSVYQRGDAKLDADARQDTTLAVSVEPKPAPSGVKPPNRNRYTASDFYRTEARADAEAAPVNHSLLPALHEIADFPTSRERAENRKAAPQEKPSLTVWNESGAAVWLTLVDCGRYANVEEQAIATWVLEAAASRTVPVMHSDSGWFTLFLWTAADGTRPIHLRSINVFAKACSELRILDEGGRHAFRQFD